MTINTSIRNRLELLLTLILTVERFVIEADTLKLYYLVSWMEKEEIMALTLALAKDVIDWIFIIRLKYLH